MEPIKVTLPTRIAQILEKDAELFSLVKSKNEPNKNKIYNLIIKNYQSIFQEKHNKVITDMTLMLKDFNLENNELIENIANYFENRQIFEEDSKETTVIRVQVHKGTVGDFEDLIESLDGPYAEKSPCLRRLFCSYAAIPLNVREQIIFKDSVNKIKKAIHEKKTIKFKQRNNKRIVHPYALVTSKEELYNYLLCKEIITDEKTKENKERYMSFRLTHIKDVFIQNANAHFTDTDIEYLEATKKLSPQYIVRSHDPKVKVLLNDEGEKQLDRIYTHRPKLVEKNGHIYTFACTEDQAKAYFTKFKRNAVIIEPKSLAEKMQKDFYETQKTYKIYLAKGLEACKEYMKINNHE